MSRLKRKLVLSVLLAAATVAVYFPVHRHPFLNLDDNQYVTNNLHVQEGLTWETVKWAFTSYDAFNWHPLTWLSHALDVQMFGLDAGAHHDVNLLLHVLNVLLLFWVLEGATGQAGRSAMVAALFALHPINVESVAWVAERKNLLSMLFFLLALGAYRWYVRRPGVGRYSLVALCFALGLMAKPQVITLPFVLLLWDYWPLERIGVRSSPEIAIRSSLFALRQKTGDEISGEKRIANREPRGLREWRLLALEKLPLCALCVASSVVTLQAQRAGGALTSLGKFPLRVRLENALIAYVRYLGKAFWPSKLALMYLHPGNAIKTWQAGVALLLLLAISIVVWRARQRRYLLVGWLWFLGTMVPMIGIVQVGYQAMADRYAYLPFIGLFLMVSWGLADWFAPAVTPAGPDRSLRPRPSRASLGLMATSVAVLLALVVVTHRQLGYWGDNLTLWSHVNDVIGPNFLAENRMGNELLRRGEPDAAMQHYQRSLAITPKDPDSNFALGVYEQRRGNLQEAIRRYQIVVRSTPYPEQKARALTYMSYAYRELGKTEQARESLRAAEELRH
ncbi:MAG TPA: tetratricopeptide repeat protein [Terriglobales bacterium]|nr:tetratricopeptide repeat protein [Terriglobales bacterium]